MPMSGKPGTSELSDILLIAEHDNALRAALDFLLRVEGYRVRTIDSAEVLLSVPLPERDACLVVDQDLPGLAGLAALEELRRRGVKLPMVLMAGHPQGMLPVLAPRAKIHLVEKPLYGGALLGAISAALTASRPPALRTV